MTVRNTRNRGLVLVQLMIAAGLFLLLLGMLFFIFFFGARAWQKSDQHADLLRNSQIVVQYIAKEGERSNYDSVTILPNRAISFLSPMDANDKFVTTNGGDPLWQKYVIFYLDNPTQEVRRLEVPLMPGAFQQRSPQPIERYNDGGGARGLDTYLVGGRKIGRSVLNFEPTRPLGRRIQVRLVVQSVGRVGKTNSTLDLKILTLPRN